MLRARAPELLSVELLHTWDRHDSVLYLATQRLGRCRDRRDRAPQRPLGVQGRPQRAQRIARVGWQRRAQRLRARRESVLHHLCPIKGCSRQTRRPFHTAGRVAWVIASYGTRCYRKGACGGPKRAHGRALAYGRP